MSVYFYFIYSTQTAVQAVGQGTYKKKKKETFYRKKIKIFLLNNIKE